ncbi:MAG: STAS domain-containing protein [Desulfuromonadales bacterium]|nr:STAS domain-containing protein [Desulfuromonadales bacterium]
MEIKVEMDNNVVILKPIGNLVASSAEILKTQVAKLLEKNYLYLLLDLSKVDFVDSSGLGACIAVNKTLAAREGVLVCAGANETILKLFRITRADQKITLTASRLDALKFLQDKALLRSAR